MTAPWLGPIRKLYERGPQCRGLAVDSGGVVLGPDWILVRRTADGYRPASPDQIATLWRLAFDDPADPHRLAAQLDGIARALDVGDLLKAHLLALPIPIGPLDDRQLQRLALASTLVKAGYEPDQPRDDRGRWTSDAAAGAAAARMTQPSPGGASVFDRLAPAALRALAQFGARFSAATAVFGILFIPTNRSLISQGTLPDRPDITYEFDQDAGILKIYRDTGDGPRQLFGGGSDDEGLYRDRNGQVIARKLDGSVAIDPDALPDASSDAPPPKNDDEPKLCPAPTPDKPGGKAKDIEYQFYVATLVNPEAPTPPGFGVKLWDPVAGKYVYFDDCRRTDGTMIDAKGTGYLDMLDGDSAHPWDWVQGKFLDQAQRQRDAAQGRSIEWHFAEEPVADYVRGLFERKNLDIIVIYSPPPWSER